MVVRAGLDLDHQKIGMGPVGNQELGSGRKPPATFSVRRIIEMTSDPAPASLMERADMLTRN